VVARRMETWWNENGKSSSSANPSAAPMLSSSDWLSNFLTALRFCSTTWFYIERLFLQVIESLIDGRDHVAGLGPSHNRAVGRSIVISALCWRFSTPSTYFRLKASPRILRILLAGFNFLADVGSDYVLPRVYSTRLFGLSKT